MSFALPGGPGFCNAVRRTLLSDVEAWAAHEIDVRVNTSCQTDEFLAHRIGLVPFQRVGHGDTLELQTQGPCVCTAGLAHQPAVLPKSMCRSDHPWRRSKRVLIGKHMHEVIAEVSLFSSVPGPAWWCVWTRCD